MVPDMFPWLSYRWKTNRPSGTDMETKWARSNLVPDDWPGSAGCVVFVWGARFILPVLKDLVLENGRFQWFVCKCAEAARTVRGQETTGISGAWPKVNQEAHNELAHQISGRSDQWCICKWAETARRIKGREKEIQRSDQKLRKLLRYESYAEGAPPPPPPPQWVYSQNFNPISGLSERGNFLTNQKPGKSGWRTEWFGWNGFIKHPTKVGPFKWNWIM